MERAQDAAAKAKARASVAAAEGRKQVKVLHQAGRDKLKDKYAQYKFDKFDKSPFVVA